MIYDHVECTKFFRIIKIDSETKIVNKWNCGLKTSSSNNFVPRNNFHMKLEEHCRT